MQSRSDPNLLELRDDIALVDARLEELIGRIDTGESGALWARAKESAAAIRAAFAEHNPGKAEECLVALENLIKTGMSDTTNWYEIQNMQEQRRRLIESERKRLVDMQQVITTERAMLLIGAITDVIRRNVTDRSQLSAISRDLNALLNTQNQRVDVQVE